MAKHWRDDMNQIELNQAVEDKAAELGIALRADLSWAEDAARLRETDIDGAEEMAEFLEAAEAEWFEAQ